jgi:hypothetical protein
MAANWISKSEKRSWLAVALYVAFLYATLTVAFIGFIWETRTKPGNRDKPLG